MSHKLLVLAQQTVHEVTDLENQVAQLQDEIRHSRKTTKVPERKSTSLRLITITSDS
jgi:hypothetical protein